jgi:hypothetical protein
LDLGFGHDVDFISLPDWDVCPPVPRAHSDLLADVVDTVDSSSRVTSSNNKGLSSAVDWVLNELADKRFPFALDLANINDAVVDEFVDEFRVADCACYDDGVGSIGF